MSFHSQWPLQPHQLKRGYFVVSLGERRPQPPACSTVAVETAGQVCTLILSDLQNHLYPISVCSHFTLCESLDAGYPHLLLLERLSTEGLSSWVRSVRQSVVERVTFNCRMRSMPCQRRRDRQSLERGDSTSKFHQNMGLPWRRTLHCHGTSWGRFEGRYGTWKNKKTTGDNLRYSYLKWLKVLKLLLHTCTVLQNTSTPIIIHTLTAYNGHAGCESIEHCR